MYKKYNLPKLLLEREKERKAQYLFSELLYPAGRILALDQTFILNPTGRVRSHSKTRRTTLRRIHRLNWHIRASSQYSKVNTPNLNRIVH